MSRGLDFTKPGLKFRKGVYILTKIVLSFNSAAYHVLWLKFLQIIFLPIDLIFFLFEKFSFKKKTKSDIPIIFVVGIQRTGSTLVSQFIEKTFPFFPIGNFNSIFKRSKYYLHKRISSLYNKANQSYKNFYGISKGFFSIGDCYELWDKWFGTNHYVLPDTINEKSEKDLLDYFSSLYEAYRKPILTKNNRNSLLIPTFNKLFKKAFFIIVRRDPLEVIRSTLKASQDFFGKGDLLWGLYPDKEFDTNDYENIIEAATVQFLTLDKLLEDQIKTLEPDSFIVINYSDFCKNPEQFQNNLTEKLNYNIKDIKIRKEPFKSSGRLSNSGLEKQIKLYLKKWQNKF